jgi:hypothetical protein
MPVQRRTRMRQDNQPRARNPGSRRLPRRNLRWRILRTLADGRDRATPVPEARALGKPRQNLLEPGAALVDHRQLPTPLRLRQEQVHEQPRHLSRRPHRSAREIRWAKVFLAVKEKIMRNAKPCYLSNDMMRRVALLTLIAVGFVPSFCIAEDGSVSGEKKEPAQNASKKSQKTYVVHRPRVAVAHPHRAGFCRDFYCAHASGSPWWPGAPGD